MPGGICCLEEYIGEKGGGEWYRSQTSSPIRPEPGRGSEIFMVPRGVGFLRFLLRHSTAATTRMAAPAAPTTIPALAPAERPELVVSSEEELGDELALADVEEEGVPLVALASEVPCVEAPVPAADEAVLVASVVAAAALGGDKGQ